MSPLKHSTNLAARMGRWSANHWKTAVFGWLAFVVASVVIGGAVGTKYLEDNDLAVGEAARATKIIEAGFPQIADEQGEIVLIQSKTLKADDPAFEAVIEDVAKTVDGFPAGRGSSTRRSTSATPTWSRTTATRRWCSSSPIGTYDEAALYIDKIDGRGRQDRRRSIRASRSTSSAASARRRPPTPRSTACSKTAGMIAIPLTLVILLLVFGSAVAAL